MSRKIIKIIVINIIIMVVLRLVFYPMFECRIKANGYYQKTATLKKEIDSLNCYPNDGDAFITQNYFDDNCKDIVDEYNNIVKEWDELSCVDAELDYGVLE